MMLQESGIGQGLNTASESQEQRGTQTPQSLSLYFQIVPQIPKVTKMHNNFHLLQSCIPLVKESQLFLARVRVKPFSS